MLSKRKDTHTTMAPITFGGGGAGIDGGEARSEFKARALSKASLSLS